MADSSSEIESDHGRIEERSYRVTEAGMIEDESARRRWPGLKAIVEITSTITVGEEAVTSGRHYISYEDYPRAIYYAMLSRGH